MVQELKGQAALVTGGGTGIGKEIALAFAKAGIDIIINYSRSEKDAADTVKAIGGYGVKALALRCDVANDADVRNMFTEVWSRFTRLDILVNCAGYTDFIDLADLDGITEEIWQRTLDVNLKGCFLCSREAVKLMKRVGGGSIINIAGTAGRTGIGSSIVYCASKAAILSITRSMAISLAPTVQVNAISPGVVEDTRWCRGRERFNDAARDATPMGRLVRTSDLAEAALWLVSGSRYINVQNITIDGGRLVVQ